jgi:hypothetical protein
MGIQKQEVRGLQEVGVKRRGDLRVVLAKWSAASTVSECRQDEF